MDISYVQETNSPFQKIDKVSILSQCPLFSGLSQWELKSISQLMRLVEYKRDEIVYREGHPSDSFYVIGSGRFEASVISGSKKKVTAYLRRGDHCGEISLLTKENHSATIQALSDSLVLELKKEDFDHLIKQNAAVSFELSRRLSQRLRAESERSRILFRSDVISVFSHQPKRERSFFSLNLAASLFHETHQKTILLDLGDAESGGLPGLENTVKTPLSEFRALEHTLGDVFFKAKSKHEAGFDCVSVSPSTNHEDNAIAIISLLNYLGAEYRFILIDLPAEMNSLVLKTLTQSDSIFFLTDTHITNIRQTQEVITDIENAIPGAEGRTVVILQEVFFGVRTSTLIRQEIFPKKRCFSLPAAAVLPSDDRVREPMVVHNPDAEYSRVVRHIARFVSNNLIGLVLGSGAAFGLAHIGVLKVLEREKIPIDVIAGSSIGALVAAVYAVNQDISEVEKAALDINMPLLFGRLIDISLYPVRGLLNGHGLVRHLKKYLGNKTFENSRIPLKITGANLTTQQSVLFDSGLLVDAVRASISIPAIFKPVFLGSDVIIDGGILDPLPIKALQAAGVNKIIAVNVFPTAKDTLERRIMMDDAAEKETQEIRKKNFIVKSFYWLRKKTGKCFSPNVFDILMNTIQYMESEIAEIESEAADVLIRPVLTTASWIEFYKAKLFIKRGEEETLKALPKIKSLVAQQNS